MIPFARMLNYGNVLWYTGTELIAWDSTGLSSILGTTSSTTDYTGRTIQSTRTTGSGALCSLGAVEKGFEYGRGVTFSTNSAMYNRDLNPSVWLTSSWTLDYWTYQDSIDTQWNYSQNSIAVSGTPGMLSAGNNRFVIGAYYDSTTTASNLGVWNNVGASGSYFVQPEDRNTWVSTTWLHVCIQYDATTNTFYFYENGVLRTQFNYTVLPVTLSSTIYCGCSNPGSPVPITIERYRLRSGVQFNLSGFSTSDIYP